MGNRRSKNPDYYLTSGAEPGRRTYARERRKLSQAAASSAPPVFRSGTPARRAGAETLARAQKRRAEEAARRSERAVKRDELERALEVESGAAPISRRLPAAMPLTELSDLGREVAEEARVAWTAIGQLAEAVHALLRSPWRLYRVLRTA